MGPSYVPLSYNCDKNANFNPCYNLVLLQESYKYLHGNVHYGNKLTVHASALSASTHVNENLCNDSRSLSPNAILPFPRVS